MNPSTIGSNDVERVAESHCDRNHPENEGSRHNETFNEEN